MKFNTERRHWGTKFGIVTLDWKKNTFISIRQSTLEHHNKIAILSLPLIQVTAVVKLLAKGCAFSTVWPLRKPRNSVGRWTDCLDMTIFGPRQANLVLIAYASSEGSGEPAHPRSLARTFAARSYKQWVKRNLQTESQIPGPSEWLGMRS